MDSPLTPSRSSPLYWFQCVDNLIEGFDQRVKLRKRSGRVREKSSVPLDRGIRLVYWGIRFLRGLRRVT